MIPDLWVVILCEKDGYKVCFTESGGIPFIGNLQQAEKLKTVLLEDYPDSVYKLCKLKEKL